MRTVRAGTVAMLGAVLLLLGLLAPAVAQVPPGDADYSAYSTGTVVHAEALEQPELQDPTSVRVVDSEVAFSGAVVESTGLAGDRFNEYGALVMPAQDGKNSYGRGYGLDVALGGEGGTDEPQLRLAGLAEAAAPPETGPVQETIGPVDGDPLAYASTLEGRAYANWLPDQCIIGSDISYGTGLAEDAQLLDQDGGEAADQQGLEQPVLATNAADPERAVSWSTSRNFLGPQTNAEGERIGDHVGVIAETRQTIAPVTFFAGTESEFTIEFAGEWVLRAHAGGVDGTAHIHYGPGETGTASPSTPILRYIQDGEVQDELTFQDILGDEGLVIPASPLAEIVVGEDPRAIGGDADSAPQVAQDGTSASAAVDVVRVKLLSDAGVGEAAEVRVGHMEVSASVPEGGLDCGIPVDKQPDQALVNPGDTFTYTIEVANPYDCELRNVTVTDTLTGDDGVTWTVDATDPAADQVSDTEIVWNDIGPIAPGGSAAVTITVTVGSDSAGGVFRDEASVTGECFDQPVEGEDEAGLGVPLQGGAAVDAPEVVEVAAAAPPALPRTGGGALTALAGLALLGAAGWAVGRRGSIIPTRD